MNDSEVRVTSRTGAQKGKKSSRMDLIPSRALMTAAKVYGFGAEKYSDNNWRSGYDWSLSYAALQRHLGQFWDGQDLDEESGLPHLAHAAFHVFALLTFMEEHPEFDDRYHSPNKTIQTISTLQGDSWDFTPEPPRIKDGEWANLTGDDS